MNRLQKREQILPECNELTIPEICMYWRMSFTGCADPFTYKRNVQIWKFLQCCLDTWEVSSHERHRKFDIAVEQLIEATLEEAKYYLTKDFILEIGHEY